VTETKDRSVLAANLAKVLSLSDGEWLPARYGWLAAALEYGNW
jgi:hypothetical protein